MIAVIEPLMADPKEKFPCTVRIKVHQNVIGMTSCSENITDTIFMTPEETTTLIKILRQAVRSASKNITEDI